MFKYLLVAIIGSLLISSSAQAQIAANVSPLTITLENYSDLDLEAAIVSQNNLNAEDVNKLHKRTIYAHKEQTFTIRRMGYPASLYLHFFTTPREGREANYPIAHWEYIEFGEDEVEVCHDFKANAPYYIGCSGDNEFNKPDVTVNIGRVIPASQPLSIPSP